MPRCDICSALNSLKEGAPSQQDLQLANSLLDSHVQRYSDARQEIERVIQIGVSSPRHLLTIMIDGYSVDAFFS